MGYTHYWNFNPSKIEDTESLRKKFKEASRLIKKGYLALKKEPFFHAGQHGGAYETSPCLIRGGLGEGAPNINESEVWFNGDAKTNLDHETFQIKWKGEDARDFCKTARKPYDILVCYALIAFDHVFNDPQVFSFSSDGEEEDWEFGRNLFTHVTGWYLDNIFPEQTEEEPHYAN